MRTTVWPNQAQNELADEAVRLLPALAAARLNNNFFGVQLLYETYAERAEELGVDVGSGWKIFGVTAVGWMCDYVRQRATDENLSTDEAATQMIARALEWTNAATP